MEKDVDQKFSNEDKKTGNYFLRRYWDINIFNMGKFSRFFNR